MTPVLIVLLVLLALALIVVMWAVGIYNNLVTLRNRFKNAFAQIDVQLKRRFDLLPIDAPVPGQPPLADAVDGVGSLGMAVQVTQEGIYQLGKSWLRFHGLPLLRRHENASNDRAMRVQRRDRGCGSGRAWLRPRAPAAGERSGGSPVAATRAPGFRDAGTAPARSRAS